MDTGGCLMTFHAWTEASLPDGTEMIGPWDGTEDDARAYVKNWAADGWTVSLTETKPDDAPARWVPRRFQRWPR